MADEIRPATDDEIAEGAEIAALFKSGELGYRMAQRILKLIARVEVERTRAATAEADQYELLKKAEACTLHVGYCSAHRDSLVGSPGCSCPMGKFTRIAVDTLDQVSNPLLDGASRALDARIAGMLANNPGMTEAEALRLIAMPYEGSSWR